MVDSGPPTQSRRSLLRAGGGLAGLLAVGGLSGCQVPFLGGGGAKPLPDSMTVVPADAKVVGLADVAAIREDQAIRDVLDAQIAAAGAADDPATLEAAMDEVESRYGLDPRGVRTAFGYATTVSRTARPTVVLETDWDPATVESSVYESVDGVRKETHSSLPMLGYRRGDERYALGMVSEGTYVVGLRADVETVIRRSEEESAAIEGDVRRAFGQTRDGYVRVGVDVPGERLARELENAPVGSDTAGDLRYAFGDLRADGSARILRIGVEVSGTSSAKNIEDVVAGLLALQRTNLRNGNRSEREQALLDGLERTTVTREGATILVRYEAPATAFGDAVGTGIAAALSHFGLV
ncbi:hypothetical protein ACKVMT_06130 [Halobacteriales archaeon Cl-PHB]